MTPTHFYGTRNWRDNTIRVACTKAWIECVRKDPLRPWGVGNGTTSPNQVTCVECLRIVVAKQERRVRILRERLRLFQEHGTEWVR